MTSAQAYVGFLITSASTLSVMLHSFSTDLDLKVIFYHGLCHLGIGPLNAQSTMWDCGYKDLTYLVRILRIALHNTSFLPQ